MFLLILTGAIGWETKWVDRLKNVDDSVSCDGTCSLASSPPPEQHRVAVGLEVEAGVELGSCGWKAWWSLLEHFKPNVRWWWWWWLWLWWRWLLVGLECLQPQFSIKGGLAWYGSSLTQKVKQISLGEFIGWEREIYFCQLLHLLNPSTPPNQYSAMDHVGSKVSVFLYAGSTYQTQTTSWT